MSASRARQRRTLRFAEVPRDSPVHRLRADTKITVLLVISVTAALVPSWMVIGAAAAGAGVAFVLARLPVTVLARPPRGFGAVIAVSAALTLLDGGSPTVAGIGLGGLLDLARVVALGIVFVLWAAVLAWTTPPAAIALGLGAMIRPLRRIGVPADELATVIALAVRSLPLVGDEARVVRDARRSRPPSARDGRALASLVDTSSVVVVGAYRRAQELARAMTVRGSVTAPVDDPVPRRWTDAVALASAAAGAVGAWRLG